MTRLACAGLVLAACLAAPAAALEHEVVIDHASGPIAADYNGTVTVETRQTGTAGVAGRPSTLRCLWSASLSVERTAEVGGTLRSRRTLAQDDVLTGTRAGWCETHVAAIDRLVADRADRLRAAMLALVEQDRATLLAEVEASATRS